MPARVASLASRADAKRVEAATGDVLAAADDRVGAGERAQLVAERERAGEPRGEAGSRVAPAQRAPLGASRPAAARPATAPLASA